MTQKYFPDIVGNEMLKERLSKDIEGGFLAHAYILEGPQGTGKHTFARQIAAAISCEHRGDNSPVPCGRCKCCEKILGDKSPDVITVGLEDDKVTIGVETVRNLKNDMFTAPNDLSVKVYIIEDADRMTMQAQNAFLLSLEEPPSYVLFFLLCENSANMLETVRSRAPALRTRRIGQKELSDYLLSHEKRATALKEESPKDFNELLFVSDGSIGYAVRLLDSKRRKQVFDCRTFAKETISLLSSANKARVLEAVIAFGLKRQDVSRQLGYIQFALRDLILLKKDELVPLYFFEERENAAELATHYTLDVLFLLYNAIDKALDDLERNANVRLTLMCMMQNAGLL